MDHQKWAVDIGLESERTVLCILGKWGNLCACVCESVWNGMCGVEVCE